MSNETFAAALRYHEGGLNVLPLKLDTSRKPSVFWRSYIAEDPFPWYLACRYFDRPQPAGIAIVCGRTSGGLEVIDIETHWYWLELERAVGDRFDFNRLPQVLPPRGGRHLYYRCPEFGVGEKLACNSEGEVRIEFRGQGHYIVAPGSPACVHRLNKPYKLVNGDLASVPTITSEERKLIHEAAKKFDERPERMKKPKPLSSSERKRPARPSTYDDDLAKTLFDLYGIEPRLRPGDEFNLRATWDEVLDPLGWEAVETSGEVTLWRRPGKSDGVSATTNYGGSDLLHVFSTSCDPLEAGESYQKFAVFALTRFDGDFGRAAKEVRKSISSSEV